MKHFLIALQFLTVLPVRIKTKIKEEDYGKSLLYFPIVGGIIGLALAGGVSLLGGLPPMVRAISILGILVFATGAIHLDGLADTCDGFYGNRPKEEILAIMRDSRIGVMGIIGITLLLLLKLALFYSLPFDFLWKVFIIMPVWGRFAQVLACTLSNYAREEGKAKLFIKYASKKELFIGALFTLLLSGLLMRLTGIILFILLALVTFILIKYIKHRINGMTGDTIGAVSEIIELSTLFFALILLKIP